MQNRQYAPSFKTLLADNVKTVGFNGGVTLGVPTALAGGVAGVGLGMVTRDLNGMAAVGALGAIVTGTIPALVGAGLASATLSLPFAISAYYTRLFKSNEEIDAALNYLFNSEFSTSTQYQLMIRNEILAANKKSPLLGIRSYESASLMNSLRWRSSGETEVERANALQNVWVQLSKYMSAKSGDKYINNGKKLFNNILALTEKVRLAALLEEEILRAAYESDLANLQLLLQTHPTYITQRLWSGYSLMELAISSGNINMIDLLVRSAHHANLSFDAQHCLEYAINENAVPVLTHLLTNNILNYEIDPNRNQKCLMLHTIEQDKPEIFALLRQNQFREFYTTPHQISTAIDKSAINILKYINDNIAWPFRNDPRRSTMLMMVDRHMKYDLANMLVEEGLDDSHHQHRLANLATFVRMIRNPIWNTQGLSLFGKVVPHGIEILRNMTQYLDVGNLAALDRGTVITLIDNIENYAIDYVIHPSVLRSTKTKALYQFGSNLSGYDNNLVHLQELGQIHNVVNEPQQLVL